MPVAVDDLSMIFNSSLFKFLIVPLIAVVLSIFVKTVSRQDDKTGFHKDDLAVGLSIALTATITLISYSVSINQMLTEAPILHSAGLEKLEKKASAAPWLIALYVLALWNLSTMVRKTGWRPGKPELRMVMGVIFPNIYGLAMLVFVVAWMGS